MPSWQSVLPGVWRFRDSCNVYAVEGPAGMLVIDAGTGAWLAARHELPKPVVALACTHYFRDHSAGAAAAARAGIPVFVPEGEREIFANPAEHFRKRETYIIYDNVWDLFAPIEPVPVAGMAGGSGGSGVLRDYDRPRLAGLEVEVVPLPGATVTQIGLALNLPAAAGRVIFCGETIHSPGRVARLAPLQYNYNDLPGSVGVYHSCRELRQMKPVALLPSLGDPILDHTDDALALLQKNLRALCANRPNMDWLFGMIDKPALERVTDHVWRDLQSWSFNWFVISKSGKALVLDYGYHQTSMAAPGYALPRHRRALLHGLEALKAQFGIDRIDTVLVSHFHDDHVCGIPLLQRLHGTQCWAAENFADLLEQPQAHCFPCDWPVKTRVDRRLPLDQPFQWEEYTFNLHAMSGHTRFSALIGFEADGKRFAHTGDQYFFQNGVEKFEGNKRMENHVYRNGALLDGYDVSAKWMLEWRPDIVLTGHQPAMFTDAAFFQHIEDWDRDYRELHQATMALGAEETHFNLDSWGGWIWPYRTHLRTPGAVRVKVTVRNPYARRATLAVRLVGPAGWVGTSARLETEARAEASCMLEITPAGPCHRQPFAAELMADGQPFGQVAEGLVSVGGEEF